MNSELVLCLILFYLFFYNNKKEFFGCGQCGSSKSHDENHIHCSSDKPCSDGQSCVKGLCHICTVVKKEDFGCGKCGTSQPHTEDDDHIHCSESEPCPDSMSCNSDGICK
jgi:hypothetical protein